MAETKRRLSNRQLFAFVIVFIVSFTISIASIAGWNQLYSSNSMLFAGLFIASALVSTTSNVVANKLTKTVVAKVGLQAEANPLQRFFYKRFGLNSGYLQAIIGIPFLYGVVLLLFKQAHIVTLSFAFTLFPLFLFYDAFQDYLVVRARYRHPITNHSAAPLSLRPESNPAA